MKTFFILSTMLTMSMTGSDSSLSTLTANHKQDGFAVIELFTSEGCSSCPPADEAMIDIENEFKKNVYVIGYHVDYWNYLGWKDIFSNAGWTDRQKAYAQELKLNSIYTPQVVINGSSEFVGSDVNRLHQAITTALEKNTNSSMIISAKTDGNGKIKVRYNATINKSSDEVLNVVLIQLSANSDVKRGENGGKKLHHINIARDLKTVDQVAGVGDVTLTMPAGLNAKDCKVIAYLQNKKTLQIVGAVDAAIE